MRRLITSALFSVLLSGCFGPSDGVAVPVDDIYFPVGLAFDKDNEHLFVVSSDFDLQYNAGAIQSYETQLIADQLPRIEDCDEPGGMCAPDGFDQPCINGERSVSQRLLYPGRCNPVSPKVHDRVKIGAFATDAVLRQNEDGTKTRLFVPVRGDSTLHWLDIDGGYMDCGQAGNDGNCNDAHRAGDQPTDNTRGITLNAEPFAVDASEYGGTIVVTNQTTGTASLFVNDWGPSGPSLQFALSSERIPRRPVGIAALPNPASLQPTEGDTFLLTFRDSAQVRLIRYAPDSSSADARPFLVDGGGVGITANSVGSDSRGVAVDSSARQAAEARCGGDQACLEQAALVPLDVYVANRSPSSLLIGRTRPPEQFPFFFDSVPLTVGPARVALGNVTTADGELERRVFVACFDSRRVFVYDPLRARMEAEILTGRGPHALIVDEKRALLFVGHFTDSYVGVYSLDLRHPATYGSMLATLGSPKPPRSSK
jgi:DNA-binding beta-propeller fold protein YncE